MSEDELPEPAASPPGGTREQADERDVAEEAGAAASGDDGDGADGDDIDGGDVDGGDVDGDDLGGADEVDPAKDVLWRVAAELRASKQFEALVPASREERAQAVAAVLAQAQKKQEAASASEKTASASESANERASAVTALPVRPVRRRPSERAVRWALVGTTALAALVVGVVLLVPSGPEVPEGTEDGRTIASLSSYAMIVEGEQTTRGDPSVPDAAAAAPIEVRPQTRLVVKLKPAQLERTVARRLVLVRDGRAMLLEPAWREKGGELMIEEEAGPLLGEQVDGQALLVVLLGRELPEDDEAIRQMALSPAAVPRHVQALRRTLRLVEFSHSSIEVLLQGCYAVVVDRAERAKPPRCEVAAGAQLLLWVDVAAADQVQLLVDGQPRAAPGEQREGGVAFSLELPASARSLEVRAGGAAAATWSLSPADLPEWARAFDAARAAGQLEAAAAALAARPGDAPPAEQLEVQRRSAKLARWRGQGGQEQKLRLEAIATARQLGKVSAEIDETVAVIYRLAETHELVEASRLMDRLDELGAPHAEGAMYRELARGQLDTELGSLASALAAQRRAYAIATRIGSPKVDLIRGPMADVLHALGRQAEAEQLIEAEIARGEAAGEPCGRVDALTTSGWVLRETSGARAQRLTDAAVALAAASCPQRLPVALVNQGWALAAAGRFREARAALERLVQLGRSDERRVTAWRLRLQAELLLEEDPAKAARYAQQLEGRAGELCSSELAYEAQLLGARAKAALRQPAAAAAAFAEAERALARWSRMVPLGEGRAAFLHRHEELARAAIPFFLEQVGQPPSGAHGGSGAADGAGARAPSGAPDARKALAGVVRRSLARFTASLADSGVARVDRRTTAERAAALLLAQVIAQTSSDWPLGTDSGGIPGGTAPPSGLSDVCRASEAAEARPAPALDAPPEQASLFVHPSSRGLLLLAWRGDSISIDELPMKGAGESPAQRASRIARAAAPRLVGAPRVELHLHRSLLALPLDRSLSALLSAETPPGQAVPLIAFAIDAPRRASEIAAARCSGPRHALLVSNPQQNLAAASKSAPLVRGQLERRGFIVDELQGAEVTRRTLVARLADPCVTLLHYDGHARTGEHLAGPGHGGARIDRLDDKLLLAGGDTLTAAEVLDLPRVPAAIVLNGCTTAASEGLGLAQAFLAAGATQVIASLDEIAADDAARFTQRLFAGEPTGRDAELDLVSLFAGAVAVADVPSLRVFER